MKRLLSSSSSSSLLEEQSAPVPRKRLRQTLLAPLVESAPPWLVDDIWDQICHCLVMQDYCLRTLVAIRRTCKYFGRTIVAPVPNPRRSKAIAAVYYPLLRRMKWASPQQQTELDPERCTLTYHWTRLFTLECAAMVEERILTSLAWPLNLSPHGDFLAIDPYREFLLPKSGPLSIAICSAMTRAWPFSDNTPNARYMLAFNKTFWRRTLLRDDNVWVYRCYSMEVDPRAMEVAFADRRKKCFKYICHAPLGWAPPPPSPQQLNSLIGELVSEARHGGDPTWLLYFFFGAFTRVDIATPWLQLPNVPTMLTTVADILQCGPPRELDEYLFAQYSGCSHFTWRQRILALLNSSFGIDADVYFLVQRGGWTSYIYES